MRARLAVMTQWRLFALTAYGALALSLANAAGEPPGGKLVRRRLSTPAEIQGYPYAAGYTWFFADGKLRECAVSRQIRFGEITIPEKSWINLRHDGDSDFVFLAHDTSVSGYRCKGGGPLGPMEGASTALYPGGKLKVCWLATDTVVGGVPCAHASMLADAFGGGSATEFHENGRLKSCKLSRDFRLAGYAFHSGEHVQLDEYGNLARNP